MACSHYALKGRNYFEHFDHFLSFRKCTIFYSFFSNPLGVFLLCFEGWGGWMSSWGLLEGSDGWMDGGEGAVGVGTGVGVVGRGEGGGWVSGLRWMWGQWVAVGLEVGMGEVGRLEWQGG